MISDCAKFARLVLPGAIVVLAIFWAASSKAQDSYELGLIEDRLKVLEGQMATVQRSVAGADAANTALRLDLLENELRRLTGRVEEMRFAIDEMARGLKRFRRNTDDRLTVLEGGEPAGDDGSGDDTLTGLPVESDQTFEAAPPLEPVSRDKAAVSGTLGSVPRSALPPRPGEPAASSGGTLARAPALPPSSTPRAPAGAAGDEAASSAVRGDYKAAIRLIRKREYAQAGDAFEQIVRRYPDDPLAGKAQYWLGQTYFSRGQYEEAANAYLDSYRIYPESSTAPDSLLKLGMSLERLGQSEEACLTYQEVESKYPRASATVKRRTASEKAKIGCR